MQRTEEVFSKDIRLETKDPFSVSLAILDLAREYGKPAEKQNIYETDGPSKRVKLSFEVKKAMDKFTSAKIIFNLSGESNSSGFLDVRIDGKFHTMVKGEGLISKTFDNYYISELLPSVKGSFNLRGIGEELEKRIKELK